MNIKCPKCERINVLREGLDHIICEQCFKLYKVTKTGQLLEEPEEEGWEEAEVIHG